jgi:hypothetical protein
MQVKVSVGSTESVRSRELYEARKAERQAVTERRRQEHLESGTRFWRHPDRLLRYTGWLQAYTLALSLGTIALFVATGISALILHNTDVTVRGQLDEMKAARRPWVAIVPQIDGDAYFDAKGFPLPITFDLHNTGLSPALGAVVGIHTFPNGFIGYFPEIERECNIEPKMGELFGIDVFPNEHKTRRGEVFISSEAIKYWLKSKSASEKRQTDEPPKKERQSISPTSAGCVTYRSPSDGKIHRTPFSVGLLREGQDYQRRVFYIDEERIEASKLLFGLWEPVGVHAD